MINQHLSAFYGGIMFGDMLLSDEYCILFDDIRPSTHINYLFIPIIKYILHKYICRWLASLKMPKSHGEIASHREILHISIILFTVLKMLPYLGFIFQKVFVAYNFHGKWCADPLAKYGFSGTDDNAFLFATLRVFAFCSFQKVFYCRIFSWQICSYFFHGHHL